MDSFISLTVPIYIGCPNIAEYFDKRGMIIVNTIEEAIAACNKLTSADYQKMLPYLKKNKVRAESILKLLDVYINNFLE